LYSHPAKNNKKSARRMAGAFKKFCLSHTPAMAIVIAGCLFRRYATITGGQEAGGNYYQYECGDEAFHSFQFGLWIIKRMKTYNIERYNG
jgi:hypothetical protein